MSSGENSLNGETKSTNNLEEDIAQLNFLLSQDPSEADADVAELLRRR